MMNRIVLEKTTEQGCRVQLVHGDLTEETVDAIVNAANSQLAHGGGVAGAIVRKGGKTIQEESWKLAPVAVGKAVITTGGNLKARFVIHTVGPKGGEPYKEEKLASAISSSLGLANNMKLSSISLPAVSTGIYAYPMEEAAGIILRSIKDFVAGSPNLHLKEIRICLYDIPALDIFSATWNTVF